MFEIKIKMISIISIRVKNIINKSLAKIRLIKINK